MANDDFFLSFGTDANLFADKVEAESERASTSIYQLAQALADYDKTLAKTQKGGPLSTLFGALDGASAKFGKLTSELVTGFDKALAGVGELTANLSGLVEAVNKIHSLKPAAKQKIAQSINDVGKDDLIATDAARTGKAVGEIIELNATQARNALKRVADINATVGRNSISAADGVKELARQIRELNGATRENRNRGSLGIGSGGGGGSSVIVVDSSGRAISGGANAPSNLPEIISDALAVAASTSTNKAASEPAPTDLAQDRLIARGKVRKLEDFSEKAAPGKYLFPGSAKGGRIVGADAREGESFEQYFSRNDATRASIEESRAALPKPDRADLVDFNQFKLSGGKAKDFVNDLEAKSLRALQQDKSSSAITAENIKASLTDLGLEQQYPALPGIIEKIFKVRLEQRAAAEKTIKELMQKDPAVTFGGGALGVTNGDFEVGNTFGAALHSVDENLVNTREGNPETVALAQARRLAQEKRKLFSYNPRTFDNAVDPGTFRDNAGTKEEQEEGLSLSQRQKQDADRRKEGREKNKATVAEYNRLKEEEASNSDLTEASDPSRNNFRTVYRGSNEPLDHARIGKDGLRVTQDRAYAEDYGGKDGYLYKAQIPASHFETSAFTDEEDQHTRLSAEQVKKYGFEQINGPNAPLPLFPKTEASGGGAGQPPKPPRNAAAAASPEPDDNSRNRRDIYGQDASKKANQSTSREFTSDFSAQISLLKEDTRELLRNSAERLKNSNSITDQTQRLAEQQKILVEAGAALKNDPAFKSFPTAATGRGVFAQTLGIPSTTDNRGRVLGLFAKAGDIDASGLTNKAQKVAQAPLGAGAGAGAGAGDGGTLGTALFGKKGFLDSQLRHVGSAIENFAGFQLVFSGFEKLKELIDTGIQADAAFVRLQASITAAGRSVGTLRQSLQGVSSGTATPLKDTIEAASELSGVFKSNQDLTGGVRVATELSNISEGALTAKESAVGLRDVIDAYGLTGVSSVRAVGDEIARLSQTTGVSVKDILEGTTQLAQEAKQFGLKQRQASVLSAYVTRSTGETGEAAAEQVSRILSTLDNGKVQQALQRIRTKDGKPLATNAQFQQGKIGDVLGNLLKNYDNLDPGAQGEIRALIGTGRQARALAGLLRDARAASDEFNNSQNDTGSLAQQNARFLATIAGLLKSLSTDFKNLGSTLQQAGVFDIIGIAAKGLDDVLKITTKVLNVFNELANSNPFTKAIKEVAVLAAEIGLIFKLFGPGAGAVLGKINPNRASTINAAGERVYAPATAAGAVRGVAGLPGRAAGIPRTLASTAGNFFVPSARKGDFELTDKGVPTGRIVSQKQASELNAATSRRERLSAAASEREAGPLTRVLSNRTPGLASFSNNFGAAATNVNKNIGGMTEGLKKLSGSFLGPLAGILALSYGVEKIFAAISDTKALGAAADDIGNTIRGGKVADNNAANQGKSTDGSFNADVESGVTANAAQKLAAKDNYSGVSGKLRQLYGDITNRSVDPNKNSNDFLEFLGVKGGYNTGFDKSLDQTSKLGFKLLKNANGKPLTERGDALTAAGDSGNKQFADEQKYIDSLGLNSEQKTNAEAQLAAARAIFDEKFTSLKATAEGINLIDQLNITKVQNLLAALTSSGNLSAETLTSDVGNRIKQQILLQSGEAVGSTAYNAISKSLGAAVDDKGNVVDRSVAQANVEKAQAAYDKAQKSGDREGLVSLGNDLGDAKSVRDAANAATGTSRGRLQGQIDGDKNARDNALIAVETSSHDGGTDAKLKLSVLDAADTKYQADKQALREFDATNAEASSQVKLNSGDTKGAAKDLTKSINALQEANSVLDKDSTAYITNLKKIQDQKKTLAQYLGESAVLAATAAAASTNDPLIRAQDEYSKALAQQKAVLAGPSTEAEKVGAQAAVDQANIAKQQQAEDLKVAQFQSSIAGSVDNSALVSQQINENLRAQKKYSDGTLASQTKLTQLKGEESTLRAKLLTDNADIANAATELQIAQLTARGQEGDPAKAAQLQVTELQAKLAQYLQRSGAKKSDPAYQGLQGQLVAAQRNAFEVSVQAQVDTLDFQRETYKITSSQEVQALQEILKNKQLTLADQRKYTLQIKNLQESIRQQLTQGGFNIPSELKLPTAFQVRRSLGGSQGNGGTTVNNISQDTKVSITNTVPNAAVAHAIANQVIALINTQTGQSARANTSTPRLVGA